MNDEASVLIDSNIIIYASKPQYLKLRQFIEKEVPVVSAVSQVEALGYHKLKVEDRSFLEEFFDAAIVLPISQEIVREAILLRQQRRMLLGDSLIAGTALSHDVRLATHNIKDFRWITGLELVDPVEKIRAE